MGRLLPDGGISKAFTSLDDYVWKLAYKWATHRHRNKPKKWIAARYFGRFHPARTDRWIFGDRDSGVYLRKFSWTKIVRHQMVPHGASPDDPALADYWATRRRKHRPPLGEHTVRLLHRQQARCPLCGDYLLHADHEPTSPQEWEQWFRAVRKAITKQALEVVEPGRHGTPDRNPTRLVHRHCHRQTKPGNGNNQHSCTPASPRGLLEPGAGKTCTPGVRREAHRRIPSSAGMNSEGGSWV